MGFVEDGLHISAFLDVRLLHQFKLYEMGNGGALELSLTGHGDFFALVSNGDFSLDDEFSIYREKDSVEQSFNSLENEVRIRLASCWSENSIYGAFLSQLVISFMRFRHPELWRVTMKFIMQSLMNFALTVVPTRNGRRRRIFSNFDPINRLILSENATFTYRSGPIRGPRTGPKAKCETLQDRGDQRKLWDKVQKSCYGVL